MALHIRRNHVGEPVSRTCGARDRNEGRCLMGVDHLGATGLRQEIGSLKRDLRRVARATLQNGSIGRAGIRVYDGGWIRIEDGGLQVTGTASVTGTLEGSGTF